MSSCLLVAFLVAATIVTPSFVSAASSPHFQAGIEAYEQGAYETAKTEFSNALEKNETAAVHHNLALTKLQLENPSAAIWHLERALLLNPLNSEYRNKLGLVRQQLGLATDTIYQKRYFQFTQLASPVVLMTAVSLSFWLLLALLVFPALIGKKADKHIRLSRLFSLLILTISLAAIWLNIQHLQTGIVISEETVSLHTAPALAAPETGFVRPGERARIRDQHNNFYQIETKDSVKGWISRDKFRLLHD